MRHARTTLAVLSALAALSLSVVAGCGGGTSSSGTPVPDGPADITGTVSQLAAAGDGTGSFLVIADPTAPGAYDRALVRTTAGTLIWAPAAGEGRRALVFDDLHDGDRVAVHFTGAVAESYPVQATAADVEVLTGD